MGVGRKAKATPRFFEIWHFPIKFFEKKVVLLVSSGESLILPLVAPAKIFFAQYWKISFWPLPGKNHSGAHV